MATRPPVLIQDPQPVKSVHVEEVNMAAKGPHKWEGRERGYVPTTYVHQEFPKSLYRPRTPEEIQEERDSVTKEMWMNRKQGEEMDLIALTGHNQKRDAKSYEAWATRPVEVTVSTDKEEAGERKKGFMSLAELKKA